MSRPALLAELLLLFLALPLAVRLSPRSLPALPVLWLATLYAFWQLHRDPTFRTALLWSPAPLPAHLPSILGLFALGATLLTLGTWRFAPHLLFSLPRTRPRLWLAVLLLYPVLSVYPQSILFRAFLLHRYAPLLPSPAALILLSASAFAFMHIVFRNRLAVALTFLGGLLFAWRYLSTASLLTSSVEHALYGCWLFTAGLGQFFYARAARR